MKFYNKKLFLLALFFPIYSLAMEIEGNSNQYIAKIRVSSFLDFDEPSDSFENNEFTQQFEKYTRLKIAQQELLWKNFNPAKRLKVNLTPATDQKKALFHIELTQNQKEKILKDILLEEKQKVAAKLENKPTQILTKSSTTIEQKNKTKKPRKRNRKKNLQQLATKQDQLLSKKDISSPNVQQKQSDINTTYSKYSSLKFLLKEHDVPSKQQLIHKLAFDCHRADTDYYTEKINTLFSFEFCPICQYFNIFLTENGPQHATEYPKHVDQRKHVIELLKQKIECAVAVIEVSCQEEQ